VVDTLHRFVFFEADGLCAKSIHPLVAPSPIARRPKAGVEARDPIVDSVVVETCQEAMSIVAPLNTVTAPGR